MKNSLRWVISIAITLAVSGICAMPFYPDSVQVALTFVIVAAGLGLGTVGIRYGMFPDD